MLLQALNLHKQYDDLPVLRGVNVDIHEGEFVAIIGQSGSGKTTLLHSLSGLTPIDRGDIFIGEHRITSKDAFSRRKRRRDAPRAAIAKLRRDHIGFIFQDLYLIESLYVEDNLRLPAKLARVSVPDQEINDALDYVGLTGKAHAYPDQLSGGQRQRVAIARALVRKPQLLFADEPTGSLDVHTSAQVMDLLRATVTPHTALVMVTHSLDIAATADRVIILADGVNHAELRTPSVEELFHVMHG